MYNGLVPIKFIILCYNIRVSNYEIFLPEMSQCRVEASFNLTRHYLSITK